jgi:hypothetical protein
MLPWWRLAGVLACAGAAGWLAHARGLDVLHAAAAGAMGALGGLLLTEPLRGG